MRNGRAAHFSFLIYATDGSCSPASPSDSGSWHCCHHLLLCLTGRSDSARLSARCTTHTIGRQATPNQTSETDSHPSTSPHLHKALSCLHPTKKNVLPQRSVCIKPFIAILRRIADSECRLITGLQLEAVDQTQVEQQRHIEAPQRDSSVVNTPI